MSGPRMDLPVLMIVWVLCVTTDWSTATKITLNIAAVGGLCVAEYVRHRRLRRVSRRTAGKPARSDASTTTPAGRRSFASA